MAGLQKFSFLLMILLLCLGAGAGQVQGKVSQPPPLGCKPQELEEWVQGKIAAGQVADFGPGDERGRIITAAFLQALLTDSCPGLKIVPFQGVRLKNAIIQGELDLQAATIRHRVLLEDCRFQDQVNFYATHFQKSLELNNSIFLADTDCHFMKVDQHLWMENAVFQKKAILAKVAIGVNLAANDARFCAKADFNGLKVGEGAYFAGVRFLDDAIFINARFTADFYAPETIFNGTAEFDRFQCANAIFEEARFFEAARFTGAKITSQFRGSGAFFHDAANFNGFKCESAFFGKKATPPVPAAGDLDLLTAACFAPREPACFLGPVNFGHARMEVNFEAPEVQFLNKKIAVFGFLKVGHLAIFDGAVFQGPVNFKNAAIGNLALGDVRLVEKEKVRQIWLAGLTYNVITAQEILRQPQILTEEERQQRLHQDHQLLLEELLGKSPFNIQNYTQMEAFAKRTGQDDWADEIFITGKNREDGGMKGDLLQRFKKVSADCWQAGQGQGPVPRLLTWLSHLIKAYFSWLSQTLTWLFWGMLTGYGRAPFRVIYLSTVFVCVGAWLFDPRYLDPHILEKWKWYSRGKLRKFLRGLIVRLSLSLDVFIPTHHPMLVEHLDRTEIPRLILFYYSVHKLAGMILIPLGAAAFLTHLKLGG